MSNRKRIASIAFTGAAAAAAVGMNMGPAAAATGSWHFNQPNSTTFTGFNLTSATLNANGIPFTCPPGAASTSGHVSGNSKPYSPPTPTQLGTISKANFGTRSTSPGCFLTSLHISAHITGTTPPSYEATGASRYHVNGKSYNPTTGVTTGSLTNISASINQKGSGWPASGCKMQVSNINSPHSPLPGSFHNGAYQYGSKSTSTASHVFAINPGHASALRVKDVTGCLGKVAVGDKAWFTAVYNTSPPLTISAG